MKRPRQHLPWRAAGKASEAEPSADDVVRETGWVFNNRTGRNLDLEQFVRTGDEEVGAYLQVFGLGPEPPDSGTIVEIGAGIGRMTAGFSRVFARVIACDLDAAFLERCRETVARFGRPERLQTVHVADGRSLDLPDGTADVVFSYITLQHCRQDDAVALSREAVRVTRPGGKVALNYRTWTASDTVLWPAGKVMRGMWRLPRVGARLAQQRTATRVGWQANRLAPGVVLAALGGSITDAQIFRSPSRRSFAEPGTTDRQFEGVHPSHWWLIATVAAGS
jgi:SAM-dependent methyltransferase